MAHEITNADSLFVARFPAWHGLGTLVPDALTSEEALKISGLNWEVQQTPIYTMQPTTKLHSVSQPGETLQAHDPELVNGWVANVRSDTCDVLGIVGQNYKIVQNRDAFAFTDSLIGEGVKYESAGSLKGGRRVWLLARLPQTSILGDKVDPFLVFTNGHDGNAAVKVAITPVRVVCMNTLNLALDTSPRSWSTTHQGDIQGKLHEAEQTLLRATQYMVELENEAERLADIKITQDLLAQITSDLFPLTKDPKRHALTYEMRKEFMARYLAAPDLVRFRGTGWGVIGAASDFAGHRQPKRKTKGGAEFRFTQIVAGHPITDRAKELVLAAA